jgi:periplasmic divalent cation tolerance protein
MSEQQTERKTGYCIVMTTCASTVDAERLAGVLLERGLAACVQVLDIQSHYMWKGERQRDAEKLLLIKARAGLYAQIESALLAIHPYETPEIVLTPLEAGSPAYFAWIDDVTACD